MTAREIGYRLEGAALRAATWLLRQLSPTAASNLGGAVARAIGPLLPVSRIAHANMKLALPELDEAARRRIIRGVWDNLGRTVAEIPHLPALHDAAQGPGFELVGAEHLHALVAEGGPAMLFSGHIANWELLNRVAAAYRVKLGLIYRAASNPIADAIINDLRQESVGARVDLFPKGSDGARGALAHLRGGGILALLTDQKMSDGISAPFFGHPAMTPSAGAALALRFRCKLLPAHAERLGPARFRVIVEPPLPLPDSGDRTADIAALTTAMNQCLEGWIRARPAEWLWLHRRWPKEFYR
jgi:Kdo2-lipid IVA lauroyltransferase/acyltransferase